MKEYSKFRLKDIETLTKVHDAICAKVPKEEESNIVHIGAMFACLYAQAGETFVGKVFPEGFVRMGIPRYENELLLMDVGFDCLEVVGDDR